VPLGGKAAVLLMRLRVGTGAAVVPATLGDATGAVMLFALDVWIVAAVPPEVKAGRDGSGGELEGGACSRCSKEWPSPFSWLEGFWCHRAGVLKILRARSREARNLFLPSLACVDMACPCVAVA